jgi:hypothetical protein
METRERLGNDEPIAGGRMRVSILATFIMSVMSGGLAAQSEYVYKIELIRAAPGQLLELIDGGQARAAMYGEAVGGENPFVIRHSQGDHWDLMAVHPIGSLSSYFTQGRVAARARADGLEVGGGQSLRDRLRSLVSWREETFFTGPPIADARPRFEAAGYLHVEMFVALPGKHAELYREREMENDYLRRIDRPQNIILDKTLGGSWDMMTIGFYRDLKHYAESADIPDDVEDRAARAAGFDGASRIGSYLRSLILRHNDTLGTPIR